MKGNIKIELFDDGGNIKDGLLAYQALDTLQKLGFKIEFIIKGEALSMASLINYDAKKK